MDRSLDDSIYERQRRAPRVDSRDRRQNWPRDGVRKSNRRDDPRNLDRDWVHDRFEDDSDSHRPSRPVQHHRRTARSSEPEREPIGTKIRVDNLHYEITEEDVKELFTRIGPIRSASLLYDRQDRSKGIAFVTYAHMADARSAIHEFDGQNANGQPIRLTLMSNPPPSEGNNKPARNPFDFVTAPSRSLFDRISTPVVRNRARSASPGPRNRRNDVRKSLPDNGDRNPNGNRRGGGNSGFPRLREVGRRPGEHRNDSARRNRDGDKDKERNNRPRKTAEQLDAEMADYWTENSRPNGATKTSASAGEDIDMVY